MLGLGVWHARSGLTSVTPGDLARGLHHGAFHIERIEAQKSAELLQASFLPGVVVMVVFGNLVRDKSSNASS